MSFTVGVHGEVRSDFILGSVRQVRTLLLERHVDAPSEERLAAGALKGMQEAVPGLPGSGAGWAAVESAFQNLEARSPDRLPSAAEAAIRRMVEAPGDPYTAVLDREEMAADREGREQGSFTGIGVELAWDAGLVVVACLEGSPAAAAGLRPGDRILRVEGRPIQGLSFYRAGDLLTGPEGTRVRLDLERAGKPLRLEVSRRRLRLPGVEARLPRPGVGLLRIGYFGPATGTETRSGLQALQAQGARSLVLDLRTNPGGDFQQGLEVAALFRSGELLQVQTREGARRLRATAPPRWTGPVVVLVDRGTASAGEIVAQALQGTPGIRVVGQRTFGKAVIQTLFPLPGGYGLRMTTGRYAGRDGRSVHRRGLQPDVELPAGADGLATALRLLSPAP